MFLKMLNSKIRDSYQWRLIVQVVLAKFLSTTTLFISVMGFLNFVDKVNVLIKLWPGEKTFGPYRFLPVFFFAGAALEYAMIHWKPNGVNFYDTWKTKQAKKVALEKWEKWKKIQDYYK